MVGAARRRVGGEGWVPIIRGCPAQAGCRGRRRPLTAVAGIQARPENINHEAHLSAKETQASSSARVPCADAHARRQAHPEAPAQQGTQAPVHVVRGRQ
jgi:hypothetical protein